MILGAPKQRPYTPDREEALAVVTGRRVAGAIGNSLRNNRRPSVPTPFLCSPGRLPPGNVGHSSQAPAAPNAALTVLAKAMDTLSDSDVFTIIFLANVFSFV